jgi:hypothetical protein
VGLRFAALRPPLELSFRPQGLCTHPGPQETFSQIRLQIEGVSQRVTATLVLDGVECTYRRVITESYHGFMGCAHQTSLPFRLWTK